MRSYYTCKVVGISSYWCEFILVLNANLFIYTEEVLRGRTISWVALIMMPKVFLLHPCSLLLPSLSVSHSHRFVPLRKKQRKRKGKQRSREALVVMRDFRNKAEDAEII